MSNEVSITIDLARLIEATLPLWSGLFVGAWVLLRLMVFKPLSKISQDLEELKELFTESFTRIRVLEEKVKTLEEHKI